MLVWNKDNGSSQLPHLRHAFFEVFARRISIFCQLTFFSCLSNWLLSSRIVTNWAERDCLCSGLCQCIMSTVGLHDIIVTWRRFHKGFCWLICYLVMIFCLEVHTLKRNKNCISKLDVKILGIYITYFSNILLLKMSCIKNV